MMNAPLKLQPNSTIAAPQDQSLGRVPYMTIQAFCETSAFVSSITEAAADRRLARADLTVSPGGLRAAVDFFAINPTPDLLVIETGSRGNDLFLELDALAEVCDAKVKVVLVGTLNDVSFYRRLMACGIVEYLVSPIDASAMISTVLRLFPQDAPGRLGKIFACIGAKGGTGSSSTAQNMAWSLAESGSKVLLADLDLQFGTAALNYNIDVPAGFTEQLAGANRLDDALLERLLYKHGPNLSILAGATASREVVQPELDVLDRILDLARATFPFVVLDLPHQWSPWVRRALLSADEVIITAEPDLGNLRNVRMLLDLLKETRPHDADPRLVLNRVGVPKRTEIKADKFGSAVETPVAASFAYEPALFSDAANGGKMMADGSGAAGRTFAQLAQELAGMAPPKKMRRLFRWR